MPSGGASAVLVPAAATSPVGAISPLVPAAFPLMAAFLALCATAVTGLSQASPLPPELAARFYGFFLQQYPLFTFAIVYGLARLVAMAAASTASLPRRIVGVLLGATLLLALSLYPTFGGFVLRAGFATGGMTFLTYQPMSVAFALGSASSAFVFGSGPGGGRTPDRRPNLGGILGSSPRHRPSPQRRALSRVMVRFRSDRAGSYGGLRPLAQARSIDWRGGFGSVPRSRRVSASCHTRLAGTS